MNAAEQLISTISEPLTWAQICERHPDSWVCLVEIDRIQPNHFKIRTARVVGYGKAHEEPWVQAMPWWKHYREIGHYFTGRVTALPFTPRIILDDELRNLLRS